MMKQFSYRHTKEAELMDSMEQAAKGAPQTDEELFSFAGFNEAEVEHRLQQLFLLEQHVSGFLKE